MEPINVRNKAIVAGVVGLLLCVAGIGLDSAGFLKSYLFGYLFWIGVAVGSLGILLLNNVTGGRWGAVLHRQLAASAMTIPIMAVLFVPILLGLRDLYAWADPEVLAAEPIVAQKTAYLNPSFFTARAVLYFALWTIAVVVLNRWIRRRDAGEIRGTTPGIRGFSAVGILLFVLTVTFASVDWSMSLEPAWYSTIHGMRYVVGFALSAFAITIFGLRFLMRRSSVAALVVPDRLHDVGNLLFAFTNLWAYLAFSQFLIIWAGDLPEENVWYLRRMVGGWKAIGILLIVFHFAVPFVILLSRKSKRRIEILSVVALGIGFMQVLDEFWQVAPVFRPEGLRIAVTDILVPLGIGGIWLAAFLWFLSGKSALPPDHGLVPEESH